MTTLATGPFDAHFHLGAWGRRLVGDDSVEPIGAHSHDSAVEGDYRYGEEHDTVGALRGYLERAGFSGGVVMPNYIPQDPAYSLGELQDLAVRAATEIPGLLVAVFSSPLDGEWEHAERALERHAADPVVRAIKFTSNRWAPASLDPATWTGSLRTRMERCVEIAKENSLVMHFHSGPPNCMPSQFDGLVREYGKDVDIQLVHSGENVDGAIELVPYFTRWVAEGFRAWCDTSLTPGFLIPWLSRAADEAGVDLLGRVMFATDAPWGNPWAEAAKIRDSAIDQADVERILHANARELYGVS